MKKSHCLIGLLFTIQAVQAQEIDAGKLLRMRDSLDNLLVVNPSSSPILVKHNQVELYSFTSAISTNQFNDKQGNNANVIGKQSLLNSLIQVNFGLSKSRRINIGFDVSYRSYTNNPDNNPALGAKSNFSSLSYAGPRIRIQPFRKIKNFIFQSYLWIPIASGNKQQLLGTDRMNWGNTFFYYKYLNHKIGIFAQVNFSFAFPGTNSVAGASTQFFLPISVSGSYVISPKDIFFTSLAYSWFNEDVRNASEGADSDFLQVIPGYQRIISKRFFANLTYSATIMARNYNKWNGPSFGIRYLF